MQLDSRFHEAENPYATPLAPSSDSNVVSAEEEFSEELPLRPFRTMWTRPRETVRRIIAVDPKLHVVLLVSLAGIGETLNRASVRNAGENLSLAAIIAAACLFGPLGGLLSFWIGSHLIRFSGSWMGGVGTREHIQTAIAWAAVPTVFALFLWIPQILLFGMDMFTEDMPRMEAQPLLLIPFLAISFAELVLGVWAFVLLCHTVAEVQGFRSAWRGFHNIILAGAVIVVPLIVIAFGVIFFSAI